MKRLIGKYWKPNSATFWLGIGQIALAVILAIAENAGIFSGVAGVVDSLSGGIKPAVFMATGIGTITMRAGVGK